MMTKSPVLIGLFALLISFSVKAEISAKSYLVQDMSGTNILQKEPNKVRPIASITKLFSVSAAIDKLPESDLVNKLLDASLIASDNKAASKLWALAGKPKMTRGNLPLTEIFEPTGLSKSNVSTATELAQLAKELFETKIAKISIKSHSSHFQKLRVTNKLIGEDGWVFHLSKTGWTKSAGGCIIAIVEVKDKPMIFVILGSTSVKQRWKDLQELKNLTEKAINTQNSESRI
jgi:D-alanyl-D-alanine carboxypeptidase